MTHDQLISKIQASVKTDVDSAVRKLRKDIESALVPFMGYCSNGTYFTPQAKEILGQLIKDDPTKGWPAWVWRNREASKLDEVLSTMDTLQRILVEKCEKQENEEG